MRVIKLILLTLMFVLAPTALYAWGPLTHVYLGTEIFYFASLLPAGLYALLKKYKHDFIYGNIMADTVLAKKYMPVEGHSHNWNTALKLQKSAETEPELAFALGYSTHLAADTVAHGQFTNGTGNLTHALMEARVDKSVGARYWRDALSIRPLIQKRNDRFLESVAPERVVFRHSTNRTLFKGVVALTGLNSRLTSPSHDPEVASLLKESSKRMIDVMDKGYSSEVLALSPIADLSPSPLIKRMVD